MVNSGYLMSHGLPALGFIIYASWWSFITSVRHIQSKFTLRTSKKVTIEHGYKCSSAMPFIFLPSHRLQQAPLESLTKLFFILIGMMAQIYQSVELTHDPINGKKHITFDRANLKLIKIYAIFGVASVMELFKSNNNSKNLFADWKLDHTMHAVAYAVEAYVLSNYFKVDFPQKSVLQVCLYTLLIYAIVGCALFTFMEALNERKIFFTYARILFTILHGTWLLQIAYLMNYSHANDPKHLVNLKEPLLIMAIVVVYFLWHLTLIAVFLVFHNWLVRRIYWSANDNFRSTLNNLILIDRNLDLKKIKIIESCVN